MKRSLLVHYNDNRESKELEIGKAVGFNLDKEFIYFEKMKDGKWRLDYSESVIDDFSTINKFDVLNGSLIIQYNNGDEPTQLEVDKTPSTNSNAEFIYFEKSKDGKWRLTFSKSVVDDFSTIKSFDMYREE